MKAENAENIRGVSLVLATHNPGKMKEFRALLAEAPVQLWSAGELGLRAPEETGTTYRENAEIKARAVLAQCLDLPLELRRKLATSAPADQSPQQSPPTESSLWVLADDSGLDLAALDAFPGPYAARLAQEAGGYGQAVERLWVALEKKNPAWAQRQNTEASMTCVLCLLGGLLSGETAGANRFSELFPGLHPGRALFFEGSVQGWLARSGQTPDQKPGQTFGEGFGYDPFFFPDAQPETHFAQMSLTTKGLHSHRGQAVRELLAQWKGRHA